MNGNLNLIGWNCGQTICDFGIFFGHLILEHSTVVLD